MTGLGLRIFDHLGFLAMWRKEISSWSDKEIIESRGLRNVEPITDFSILKEKGLIFEEGQEIDEDLITKEDPHAGIHWSLQFGDPSELSIGVNNIRSICFIKLIMPKDGYDINDMARYSNVIFTKAQKGKILYDENTGASGVILKYYSEPISIIENSSLMEMKIIINWQSKVASRLGANYGNLYANKV